MAELRSANDDGLDGPLIKQKDAGDASYGPNTKKAKKPRKPRRDKEDSLVMEGEAKPPEKVPPPDHLFKLPAETRNQIYEYVLDEESWSPKEIGSGDDDEPALLRVCPQVRHEAIGIYYSLYTFIFNVEVEQLNSLQKWISSIRTRLDQNSSSAFGGLKMYLKSLSKSQLALLLPLAQISQANLENFGSCTVWDWAGPRDGLPGAVQQVIKLGKQAGQEEWHEKRLSSKFEEWLAQKLESLTARHREIKGYSYGTDDSEADAFEIAGFSKGGKSWVGTSDRKLRSQG